MGIVCNVGDNDTRMKGKEGDCGNTECVIKNKLRVRRGRESVREGKIM